ncbi:class I SAM-dependent methyltransferase [Leptolyngbya sp. FACHB-261]|uniref:class I SAM-dependent methyltransferase n=1 Tax=Leptolyngbya sp. FACHB-261 TaxID=2692806 RepID=UPI001F54B16A|nr:methyltransferase domain-containing protein [Leptolyngbya sp. FACHB-261]
MLRLVTGLLAVKPVAALAKLGARNMMINRAESMGVMWRSEVQKLRQRDWQSDLEAVTNPEVTYPDYYLTSFHAYEDGNMNLEAALEVEVAAYAVHSRVWSEPKRDGDACLRQSYHSLLQQAVPAPQNILDIGCSVGMSTMALQEVYPTAQVVGLDLSPYYLAVAQHRYREQGRQVQLVHAAAEQTGLPDQSFDLVSMFLVCHELPQAATVAIFREARRLLRPGGSLAIMDMNPSSEIYRKMPPYVLTLLKSTEPYLNEYFTLDIEQALVEAGFNSPTVTSNSPRHRTVIATVA